MYLRSTHNDSSTPARAASAGARLTQACQVQGCATQIPRRHLMCPQHWYEVPAPLRAEVEETLAAWLAGKCDVRAYLRARLRALIAVTALHNGDTRSYEAQLARWTKTTETGN